MRTIDKIITRVNSQFGAPMGRMGTGVRPYDGTRVFDCAVPMYSSGDYDRGGAYWGIAAQLRVEYTKDLSYIHFYRRDEPEEILFLTEEDILTDQYRKVGVIFASDEKEWKRCVERDYIPDLFDRDPDYIHLDGVKTPFIDHQDKRVRYVISPMGFEGDEEKYITELFKKRSDENIIFDPPANTWSWFNSHDAIAYRGGQGYVYSIWGLGTPGNRGQVEIEITV